MWLQVAPGRLATATVDLRANPPKFAVVADYLRLLHIPGSRKGGKFYPDGIVLAPELEANSAGRRLLSRKALMS